MRYRGKVVYASPRGFCFVKCPDFVNTIFVPSFAFDKGHGYTYDDIERKDDIEFTLTTDSAGRLQGLHAVRVKAAA